MAEHGAHLTSGGGSATDGCPSIFEVLAQESLLSAVRPAVKHVFRVLAEKNPSRLGFLYQYSDEVYATLDLILQNHYLHRCNASFAENFYGLKRVPVDKGAGKTGTTEDPNTSKVEKLSPMIVNKSLFFLVVLPYVRLKLDHLYEALKSRQETFSSGSKFQTLKALLCKAFLGVYPYLHLVLEGAMFIFQLRYLFKRSEFHSPWLKMTGAKLQSLTQDDIKAQLQRSNRGALLPSDSWPRMICYWLSRCVGGVAIVLSNGLSVSVFFLQFLEWWYSSGSPAVSLTALPTPNPPKKYNQGSSTCALDTVCPLCGKMRTNETALSVSGCVFCYPCIYRHLQQHESCPVTGYPANTDHLVRIYSQES